MLQSKQLVCPAQIEAVIFDVDGLLLDTEGIYTDVTQKVIQEWGDYSLSNKLKASLLGLGQEEGCQRLIDAFSLPVSYAELLLKMEDLYRAYFPNCKPKQGAKELVLELIRKNVPIAIGTSSSKEYLDWKLQKHQDWFSHFQTIVTPEHKDVQQAKPSPDIYVTAAKELGIDPQACIVFEDSPAGISAAKSAGMYAVAIPEETTSLDRLQHADTILTSLSAFTWHT